MSGTAAPGTSKSYYAAFVTAVAAVVLSLLVAAGGLATWFQSSSSRRAENKATWHAVICAIERAALQDPFESNNSKRATIKFYDGILVNNVHTEPCGLPLPPPGGPR